MPLLLILFSPPDARFRHASLRFLFAVSIQDPFRLLSPSSRLRAELRLRQLRRQLFAFAHAFLLLLALSSADAEGFRFA